MTSARVTNTTIPQPLPGHAPECGTDLCLTCYYEAMLGEAIAERNDTALILHARAVAGSEASKSRTEFAWHRGRFAGVVYCSGERWIAFDRWGKFLAAGLELALALQVCRDSLPDVEAVRHG